MTETEIQMFIETMEDLGDEVDTRAGKNDVRRLHLRSCSQSNANNT